MSTEKTPVVKPAKREKLPETEGAPADAAAKKAPEPEFLGNGGRNPKFKGKPSDA